MFHRYLVILLFKLLLFRLAVPYFPPEVLLVRQHEKLFRRFQRFAQLDMLLHILLDIILVLFSLKYVNEAA